jgi:HK97 family phage major capsid protein
VLADVLGLPWKLPDRYRSRAVWLMHPTAAGKIAAITYASGAPLWPNPGNPDPKTGGGLCGWPAYIVPGLPDPRPRAPPMRPSCSPT